VELKPNCAIKPIAEQALRSNQTIVPQRLIAALALIMKTAVTCKSWLCALRCVACTGMSELGCLFAPNILLSVANPSADDWELFGNRWMAIDSALLEERTAALTKKLEPDSREAALAELVRLIPKVHELTGNAEVAPVPWPSPERPFHKTIAIDDCRIQIIGQCRAGIGALLRFTPLSVAGPELEQSLIIALEYFRKAPLAWSALPVLRLLERIVSNGRSLENKEILHEVLGELLADTPTMHKQLVAAESLVARA
jgi:hypothetical protein